MKKKTSVYEYFSKINKNTTLIYTAIGVLFGLMFPITAFIFEIVRTKMNWSIETIKYIHHLNPLLFMIDTAPFFLGIFAYVAGCKQYKTLVLAENQFKIINTDELTKFKNRHASELLIKKYFEEVNFEGKYLTIVIFNIRNIKKINSLMGIRFGDETIIAVSKIISEICKNTVQLFRISESDFMIVKLGKPIKELVIEISNTFSKPIKILNSSCYIELNVGVAYCDHKLVDKENLVDNAYTAMERHRQSKLEKYIMYDKTMKPEVKDVEMESMLFYALNNKEFFLVYQPIVNTKTKEIEGFESLIRWKSEKFGIVSPFHFVPILERTNLIIEVGFWIIKQSCAQILEFQKKYHKDFFISINVSVNQLFDISFSESLNKIVEEVGIDKKHIRLEITESASQEKRSFVRDKIDLLYNDGYLLSIDDFGTGYSSLAELENMNLNCLKVDKSFIDKVQGEQLSSPVIEMIINMSKKMHLKVVMEGVETELQYKFLNKINCDLIQGYLFYKPLEVENVYEVLDEQIRKQKIYMVN